MRKTSLLRSALFSMICASFVTGHAGAADVKRIDVPAGDLVLALESLAKQAGVELVYQAEQLKGVLTRGAKGELSAQDAVKKLLEGTQLRFSTDASTGAMLIAPANVSVKTSLSRDGKGTDGEGANLAQADQAMRRVTLSSVSESRGESDKRKTNKDARASMESASDEDADSSSSSQGIPEILVKGTRSLNTDIKRTEDDPQPYVVFNSEEIQRSQAVNLEDFLRTRLPMNTAAGSNAQTTGRSNTTSAINLRGLGTNQTLILVDGRRLPGRSQLGGLSQPDINGIPLAAVERIEVLPSTAGGIYGGSATGGVINIILRSNFRGLEAKANYANTVDTDAGIVRLDLSAGFTLEGGRTRVMVAATRAEANVLTSGDRDFSRRGIALQLANNPAFFTNAFSPPTGATVNIKGINFNTFQPANLVLDPAYGGRALGTSITHIPLGYAGPASDNAAALIANAGRYNLALSDPKTAKQQGLAAAPGMESATLNARREFGARIETFVDLSVFGNRGGGLSTFDSSFYTGYLNPVTLLANAPTNPFQQDLLLSVPTPNLSFDTRTASTTVRATGGIIVRLPGQWMGEVDYGWSRSRYRAIGTGGSVDFEGLESLMTGLPAADGRPALNALQEGNTFPVDFSPYLLPSPNSIQQSETIMKNTTLRMSGPTVRLPGGPVIISALIERREEALQTAIDQFIDGTRLPTYAFYPHSAQNADSYYFEARTPLVSAANAIPLVRELELQASMRRDSYETIGTTVTSYPIPSADGPFPPLTYTTSRLDSADYTLALRYAPFEDLTLRASFGSGFLPPAVTQIAPYREVYDFDAFGLVDPRRGNTLAYIGLPYTYITGGSPGLQPEKSRSGSLGLIFTPRFVPALRLSIDYTHIEKIDEIQTPTHALLLASEDILPGRIVRGPKLPSDPADWAGPITLIDTTLLNIAKTSVDAYDIKADYSVATQRLGEFHGYVLVTWQPHYENQVLPTAPMVDRAGFTGGPLEWRGNMGFEWKRGPLTLGWNAQYYDAYWVYDARASASAKAAARRNQGSATIPRQVYHDLIAAYRFDRGASRAAAWFADSELSLGIQNLFDRSPPILALTSPIGAGYSPYGDPRLRRYSISFRKNFGLR